MAPTIARVSLGTKAKSEAPAARRRRMSSGDKCALMRAKIASLKERLAVANRERDDRTQIISQWENHSTLLKDQVSTLKVMVSDRDDTIKQFEMKARLQTMEVEKLREQSTHDQLTISLYKQAESTIKAAREEMEESQLLIDEKDRKIEELREASLEVTRASILDKSKATEELFAAQEQLLEQAKKMAEVQSELEVYKQKLDDILMEEKERVWKICAEWDELCNNTMTEEHEKEKKELQIEIKARQVGLEIMVEKLHKVAREDEHFRMKLEEIRELL